MSNQNAKATPSNQTHSNVITKRFVIFDSRQPTHSRTIQRIEYAPSLVHLSLMDYEFGLSEQAYDCLRPLLATRVAA